VLEGARQWWRRVGRATPCRFGCGAAQGLTRACQNAVHALGAPGDSMASGWHGQGAVHGRSGVGAARGIGHRSSREAGGEVTAREGVGAVLPKRGVHGGHGGILGRRRGSRFVTTVWGRGEWLAGMAQAHWELARVAVSKRRRGEGFWQGDSLRLLLSLESNWKRQEENSLPRSPRLQRGRGNADLPLVGFA
jgi:hypothetical protein